MHNLAKVALIFQFYMLTITLSDIAVTFVLIQMAVLKRPWPFKTSDRFPYGLAVSKWPNESFGHFKTIILQKESTHIRVYSEKQKVMENIKVMKHLLDITFINTL